MNGVHDMGGLQCFGPVRPERDEPLFHAPWEREAMALTVALGASGQWNIDQMRSARESLPPTQYLGLSYYQIWIQALCDMLLARGLVTPHELRAGRMIDSPKAGVRVLAHDAVDAALRRGSPSIRETETLPLYAPGQRVQARAMHPTSHTRLPRYVRGHVGVIVGVHGFHVWPDAAARDRYRVHDASNEAGQWLYNVRFEGTELWGPESEPGLRVNVDAWESYLEQA